MTTVNGQGLVGGGAIVEVNAPNTEQVNIQGLTFTGGGSSSGATVRKVFGSLEIRNCIFATNYNASVASVGYQRSNTFVIDCVFRNNNAENYSGVLGVTAIGCLFYGNTGWNNAIPLAISAATNCTVYGNSGGFYGGGVSEVNADNCIIWGNDPPQRSVTVGTITFSIVQGGYTGTGNLSSDPLFVDPTAGDFHLQTNSPAKHSGDPTILNADGSRSDMGAYGGNFPQAQQDPTFVWTKLPGSTNMPSLNADTGWRSLPGSMDESRRIIYSLSANGVFWKYDIGSNLFTQLPVSGAWPGRVDTFVYNPEENSIWFTLYGRGQVFRLPVTGGAFTSVGSSGASSADFGSMTFWNPVTHKFATFGGYGFMAVRNWRWELGTTDSDWVQIEPNTPGRQPWCRQGGSWTVDNTAQRVFFGAGIGNSSGNQGQVDAGFDVCADNRFDYLRDLWLLDLKSNKWVNLIPLNTATRQYGALVYFPPQNMLLMINGRAVPSSTLTNGLWTFAIGQATNFTKATTSGTIPNAADDIEWASWPYYDSLSQRVIYFNTNGVYALGLTSPAPSFLTNGLEAYYPFNGNANDASGNGHNGTAFDTTLVQDQFGLPNSAFEFNGVSSYVEVMNYLPDMASASFSVWVYSDHLPTAAESYHEIFCDADPTPDRDFSLEFMWNVGVLFSCKDNSRATIPLPLLRTNSWMNVIGVADATAGKMYLWLDGAPVATNSFTGNANVGYHYRFNIGRGSDGVHVSRYLAGRIDNLRIYNRALSTSEVQQLYAYESTPVTHPPSITSQPVSQSVNQGSPASFSVVATGTGLGFQWRLNTVNISGATNASYSLASATTNDARTYNVIVSNAGGSVTSSNAVLTVIPPFSTATGTATLFGIFVVGANITDGGSGYTNTPVVRLVGGGGSGAQAVAVVSNGVVTAINILDAGYGYTNAPLVVIDPPFIANPVLGIAPMAFLTFTNLTVGGSYQLQRSMGWYWSNQPVSFTATDVSYTQMVAGVAGSGDYRLALNPVPAQAFATAQVVNGFVVAATVTSGGSGYVTSPTVNIVGGGGTNATGLSHISGGVVTAISITDAGIGYTNIPTIRIAAPPAAAVSPTVLPVMRVDAASLAPYNNYQIQFKPDLGEAWGNWNGGLFTPTGVTNSQYLFITNGASFFRLQHVP
ncbi:MAG: hypothetical protein NT154_36660 [Verrucomicrobia bacterium]|nr:hypothetical protein [Verrucomicrobiota bacterium]